MSSDKLRILEVKITNLFGIFNHVVKFKETITIIHGPNGFGKTVILSMIHGFFEQDFSIFYKLPFGEFSLELSNGTAIKILKEDKNSLKLVTYSDGKTKSSDIPKPRGQEKYLHLLSFLEEAIPGLRRTGKFEWIYLPSNETLSFEEVLQRYGEILPQEVRDVWKRSNEITHIKDLLITRFIRTQRLQNSYTRFPPEYTRRGVYRDMDIPEPAVIRYSHNLVQKIRKTVNDYGVSSQRLDRTFPKRLVEQMSQQPRNEISREQLLQRLQEQEEKRKRLIAAGLLSKEDGNIQIQAPEIDATLQAILPVYLKDVEEKLQTFDDMLKKIELFKEIINRRFLYKSLNISSEKGFILKGKGKNLSPENLSSGEQHQLVLFYELLFEVESNTLILLDEPELSLHIAWQMEFLNDLEEIIKLSNVSFLIATHSPAIINERWDLTVQLEGPLQK